MSLNAEKREQALSDEVAELKRILIDIFDDYSECEAKQLPTSIEFAWRKGLNCKNEQLLAKGGE